MHKNIFYIHYPYWVQGSINCFNILMITWYYRSQRTVSFFSFFGQPDCFFLILIRRKKKKGKYVFVSFSFRPSTFLERLKVDLFSIYLQHRGVGSGNTGVYWKLGITTRRCFDGGKRWEITSSFPWFHSFHSYKFPFYISLI